jgi:Zn-dependent protease
MFDLSHFNPQYFIISILVLVCSISLHEFGHAISADYLGDPGPRRDGRITLWPDKHFDPVGFTMLILTSITGFGLAWGKPVMVNTRYFKKPNRDMMIVTAFGPLMNLALALAFGLPLRFIREHGIWAEDSLAYEFFFTFVRINLGLMFFNLIPIPPLDGSKILYGLLPFNQAVQYERFMGQYGFILLIIIIMTRASTFIIGPAIAYSLGLIIGGQWISG